VENLVLQRLDLGFEVSGLGLVFERLGSARRSQPNELLVDCVQAVHLSDLIKSVVRSDQRSNQISGQIRSVVQSDQIVFSSCLGVYHMSLNCERQYNSSDQFHHEMDADRPRC
jgi:hypothetical protein